MVAPPRRRPDVPAPLRRAARAAWRAPRHLPAAVDRPLRRSLRRGDGAPRPAHRVATRRSARDRARRGWRPAGRDHRRRPHRSPRGARGGIRRPAVVASVGRRASQRWRPDPPVFEPGFRIADALAYARPVVLGGGLSAFQLALWLAGRRPGSVTLLARHDPRIHEFDADSRWMGPLGWREFARLDGAATPRSDRARAATGSVPAEIARRARTRGLRTARCGGCATRWWGGGRRGRRRVTLGLGRPGAGDGVLLATGFHPRRPGGGLLDGTIGRLGLECAACGYPVVDSSLRWGPGLYVTGPLAELEIGPVARNILGARLAGERLAAVARVDRCAERASNARIGVDMSKKCDITSGWGAIWGRIAAEARHK